MNKLKDAVGEAAANSSVESLMELFRIIERYSESSARPCSGYRFVGKDTAALVAAVFKKAGIACEIAESNAAPGVFTLKIETMEAETLRQMSGGSSGKSRVALLLSGKRQDAVDSFPDVEPQETAEQDDRPGNPDAPVIDQELVSVFTNVSNSVIEERYSSLDNWIVSLNEIEEILRRKGTKTYGLFLNSRYDQTSGRTIGRYARFGDGVINAAPILAAPMELVLSKFDANGDINPLHGYFDDAYYRATSVNKRRYSAAEQYKDMKIHGILPSALLVYGNEVLRQTPETASIILSKEKTLQYIRYLYSEFFKLAGLNLKVLVNVHTRLGVTEFNKAFNTSYYELDSTVNLISRFIDVDDLENEDGEPIEFCDDRDYCGDLLAKRSDVSSFSMLFYGVAIVPSDTAVSEPIPEPIRVVNDEAKTDNAAETRVENRDLAAEWFYITHQKESENAASVESVRKLRTAPGNELLQMVDEPGDGPVTNGIKAAVRLMELDSGIETGAKQFGVKIYSGITSSIYGNPFAMAGTGDYAGMFPGIPNDNICLLPDVVERLRNRPDAMMDMPDREAPGISRTLWIIAETDIPYSWVEKLKTMPSENYGISEMHKLRRFLFASVAGNLLLGVKTPEFLVKFATNVLPSYRGSVESPMNGIANRITACETGKAPTNAVSQALDKMQSALHELYRSLLPGPNSTIPECGNYALIGKTYDSKMAIAIKVNANWALGARYEFRLGHEMLALSRHAAGINTAAAWMRDNVLYVNPDITNPVELYSDALDGALAKESEHSTAQARYNEPRSFGWLSPLFQPFCDDLDAGINAGSFTRSWYCDAGPVECSPENPRITIVPDFE